MKAAGWLHIREQILLSTLVYTWKVIHTMRPLRMHDRFRLTDDLKINIQDPRLQLSQGLTTDGEQPRPGTSYPLR